MRSERRDKKQDAIREEIKETARQLMAEHGTNGLSVRLIARTMDITPAALYYYFPSLEALITALLVDSFNGLGEALEQAGEEQEAAMALALAYRRWALANPVNFQLIFGNPIPGYKAPTDLTIPAVIRAFRAIVRLAGAILQGGADRLAPEYQAVPAELESYLSEVKQRDHYQEPVLALYLGVVLWTRMQGMVMPEVTHHLQPVIGNSEVYYRVQMADTFRAMGLRF